ncbi:hypothetical protein THII_0665 [Thioploca ingrica]|uniref:Right handed beta helix domain-containing protein n=1 Tax=Thioploca ingrica TaxID=40754 RepID=A0A090AHY3_9GAMM|nr:hypothetical protein THII_0665 [Thioploca ingrica]
MRRRIIQTLLSVLILAPFLPAHGATTYYFSSSGGKDTNNGTSEATPLKSLDKINANKLPDNTTLLFKRGDVFRGGIDINAKNTKTNGLFANAYGAGPKPVISGSVAITNWQPTTHPQLSSQVWEATAPTTEAISHLFVSGKLMTIARYPNVNSPADKNWLNVDKSAGTDSFTDTALANYSKPDGYWVGATLRLRSYSWTFTILPITGYQAAQGKITATGLGNQRPGWGYFVDGKLEELDSPGEWYYDATTKKVYLYPLNGANPNQLLVEGSVYKTGWRGAGAGSFTLENLVFQHFQGDGVQTGGNGPIIIRYCDFKHNGNGLSWWNAGNILVSENTFDHHLVKALDLKHDVATFHPQQAIVEKNKITYTAMYPGYGIRSKGSYEGTAIQAFGEGYILRQNVIDYTGWVGLYPTKNGHHTIENNTITHSLALLNDGGAIFIGSSNNIIRGNFLGDTIGNVDESNGCFMGDNPCYHLPSFGMGIGADKGYSNNVIENNTIYNNHDNGIRLNVFKNTTVKKNTLYNNGRADVYFDKDPSNNSIVTDNIMYSLDPEQRGLSLAVDGQGNQFDNNYYCNPYSEIISSPSASLALWQQWHPTYEVHSRQCGEHFDYQITNTNTTDAIVNATFDKDASGWGTHEPNPVGLDGGSLKVTFVDNTQATTVSSPRFNLVAGQLYRLKFSTIANNLGVITVMISDAPKGQPTQWLRNNPLPFAYWPQRRDQQMLFTSPKATPDGRITFSIKPQAKSDIVWLDNIVFEPIEAGNWNNATKRARLFTNPTAKPSTISLGAATYRNLDGQPVSGSLTLAPFTSQILVLISGEPPPLVNLLELTINKAGNGTGTVTANMGVGSGVDCDALCVGNLESYELGSQVTLTATPDIGSTFVGWSGTGCADSFTINNPMTCTATFNLEPSSFVDHLLKVNVNGEGKVMSDDPTGIDCPTGVCEKKYSNGMTVKLSATATTASVFKNWSGDCSGTEPEIIVTMDADKSCTANFDLSSKTYILTVEKQGDGSVTSDPVGIDCGNTCSKEYLVGTAIKLNAIPTGQSKSFSWSENCQNGEVTLTADTKCQVTFTESPNPVLQINKSGDGNGTVTGTNNLNCGATCTQTYLAESTVELTAIPDSNSGFVGWMGEGCADSFIITNDMNCTAIFERAIFEPNIDSYPLTVQLSGTGHGKVQSDPTGIDCDPKCTENYLSGTSVTLTALPAAGFTFIGWDGDCQTDKATTIVMMTEAKDCTAQFAPTQYTLTLTKQGNGTVISQPDGLTCGDTCTATYPSGTVVTLQPTVGRITRYNGDPDCQDGQVTLDKDVQCEVVFETIQAFFVAPPCPAKDIINYVCNGKGQTIENLTIEKEGNVSNVKLTGQSINKGRVSNATIEAGATVKKGIFSGNITNHGTMQDFDFRGGKLSGGNLGGSVASTGTLEDVSLAAGAKIKGGKLAKTVTGDPKNKAVLENLEVLAGTRLANVVIGDKVKLADAITAIDVEFRAANLNNATLGGNINNTGGGTITNAHLKANTHLTGGQLSGKITGEADGPALLENLTIKTGTLLSYVRIGNKVQLPENVALANVEFQGELLQGATLSGTIKSGEQSTLKDVHFKGDTHLIGGKLGGKISGNRGQPVGLEQLEILPGSELSQVLIGPNVVLPKDVVLTDGIQFTDVQAIPTELELSKILPSLRGQPNCVVRFSQPKPIDLTATLFPGGASILEALNEIPDVQARGWKISQDKQQGYLQVAQDNSQVALQPWSIKRNTVDKAQMQMTEQQTTMFITKTGLEVLAQPAVQAPCELQAALEGLNLPTFVMQPNGNVIIPISETAWYSARPDAAAREITAPTTPGINFLPSSKVAGTVIAQQVFTDRDGKQRDQLFYPATAIPEVLDKSADKITMGLNGIVTFTLAGQNYHGLVDYAVTKDKVTTDSLKVQPLPDSNGDGQKDWLVLYPAGEQQRIFAIQANN